MFNLLLSPFRKIYMYAGLALATIIALITFGKVSKKKGENEAIVKQVLSNEEKRIKGREAAYKEKRDADGISDSDLIDRLRRRGDDWGSL